VGVCPPPMETPEGWLVLYYGAGHPSGGQLFRLGLALLDLDDPRRVIRRSQEWVFGPQALYESDGQTKAITFPCGWLHQKSDGKILLYYGAAGTSVCMAEANFGEVVDYALSCPMPS
jgi:beta-1,4-mannooligosaccharide/beta-1,4-mannosyl-N-acetylglucosamine phosphorylase